MSRRRRPWRAILGQLGGTFRLGVVLALLVGVNIYVFFFSPGSLRQVSQAAQAASTRAPVEDALAEAAPAQAAPAATPAASTGTATPPKAKPRKHEGSVKEREGLGAVLRREGLLPRDADAALRALQPIMNFRKELRAGQGYTIRLDAGGRLEALELRVTPTVAYAVTRGPDGKLTAERLASAPRLGHH